MHTKKLSAVYTEFYKLLDICATIPVTSACNEVHTAMKFIKTETRYTSGDARTEALLVIAVEKQICNVTVIACRHICRGPRSVLKLGKHTRGRRIKTN